MYELYIANKNYSSWSLRPWVLMREAAIPFSEIVMPFKAGANWEAFRAFSPTGRVPVLVDDGRTVWDSLAIAEYLAERHTGIWPSDPDARVYARCTAAEMHSGFGALRSVCSMNVGVRVELSAISPALQADIDRIDELWSEGLSAFGGPFLAGEDFSAADAFFCPVAFRIRTYGLTLSPESMDYADRLLALSSMREWEKAGLAETWRDAAHEADLTVSGRITADLRVK